MVSQQFSHLPSGGRLFQEFYIQRGHNQSLWNSQLLLKAFHDFHLLFYKYRQQLVQRSHLKGSKEK